MKRIVALGCMAALLMSCAAGDGRTWVRGGAAATYLQQVGPAARSSPAQEHASAASSEPGAQLALQTRQSLLAAVNDVDRLMSSTSGPLHQLAANPQSLSHQANGMFNRYIVYGSHQLPWLQGALADVTTLADVAWKIHEPDMELALLRISGPRLQAAMSGATLLAAWLDFLTLADAVLRQCPAYSVERLFRDMHRVQMAIEPSMRALSSLEPTQVESAAASMPGWMVQLTREFHSIQEGARAATERAGQLMAAAQLVEMLTLVSTMKLSLPRLPPAAPLRWE